MEVVEDKAIVLEVVRIQERTGESVVDFLMLKDTNFIALIVVGTDIYKRLDGILLVGDTHRGFDCLLAMFMLIQPKQKNAMI